MLKSYPYILYPSLSVIRVRGVKESILLTSTTNIVSVVEGLNITTLRPSSRYSRSA